MKLACLGSERGQNLVVAALLMPVLLVFVGLVADVGAGYSAHRSVQNAADAAAMAGAMALPQSDTVIRTAVYEYSASNGYDSGHVESIDIVRTGIPRVTVLLREDYRPVFARILWNGSFTIRARAAASHRQHALGSSVIVLAEHMPSVTVDGTPHITLRGGYLHVNSDHAAAILPNGNHEMITTPAGMPTHIYGACECTHGIEVNPPPVHGPVLPDPLARLPEPVPAGDCPVRDSSADTLLPGIYPNGIRRTGGTVTLDPRGGECGGIYYIYNGLNLDASLYLGGNVRVNGLGPLMLYIGSGGFSMSGNTVLNAQPMASGTYAGLLIFQARNNYSEMEIDGVPDMNGWNGIIYMKNGTLSLSGTGTAHLSFVVNQLHLNGDGEMTVDAFTSGVWPTEKEDILIE